MAQRCSDNRGPTVYIYIYIYIYIYLHKAQKIILQQKLWLDDIIVNAAAKLLKHQFPHQEGLQSTLLASTNKCQVLAGGAIQVLHVRSNHWICIHVNRNKSLVEVYDSKYTIIPMAAVDLILQLIQSDQDAVTINCMKMQ